MSFVTVTNHKKYSFDKMLKEDLDVRLICVSNLKVIQRPTNAGYGSRAACVIKTNNLSHKRN